MNLLFILFFPLLAGAILLIAKPAKSFIWSLGAALIELGATGYLLTQMSESQGSQSFTHAWIPEVGISFSLLADGISGILIGLCALLVPFIIASTANTDKANNAQYQGLILTMQTALMGAFLAKDAFLLYFFFEAKG
jgi:NADH-quinone oxidoreductase subunit M